jgi:predicted nuclease with TOPRIM domain
MFSTIKILAVVLPLLALGGGLWYTDNLKEEIKLLEENQVKLNSAVDSKNAEIERLNQNVEEVLSVNVRLSEEREKLSNSVDVLRDKLSEHDLGYLAENKPGLIEKIINKDIEKTLKNDVLEIMRIEND